MPGKADQRRAAWKRRHETTRAIRCIRIGDHKRAMRASARFQRAWDDLQEASAIELWKRIRLDIPDAYRVPAHYTQVKMGSAEHG